MRRDVRRIAFGVVVILLVVLSGARLMNDNLRRATAAVSAKVADDQLERAARAEAPIMHVGGSPREVDAPLAARPPRQSFPRPTSDLAPPAARPAGSDALGTSLAKSARWRALGGHGRNGVG